MVISASRRTDIPALYADWFVNRIKEQYVLVRGPRNPRQVSRVDLSPSVVDGIVLWSKNPKPMLGQLASLQNYAYYFQYTLNPYDGDVEPNLPPLEERIDTFKRLVDCVGSERVVWRYDPILVTEKYTLDYHKASFERMASTLSGYANACTISFLDSYQCNQNSLARIQPTPFTTALVHALAKDFSGIAGKYNLKLETCAEAFALEEFGIGHARCVDYQTIGELLKHPIENVKDKNQREECGCMPSVDIGAYNTCTNGCIYCYANHNQKLTLQNYGNYDSTSPFLCSNPRDDDSLSIKKQESLLGQIKWL